MEAAYRASDDRRAAGGPSAAPLHPEPGRRIGVFRPGVHEGGALVPYAPRRETGRAAFERLEGGRVTRHRDGNAGTSDLVRPAPDTAGRDLTGFQHPWLHGATTPPVPGHPERRAPARDTTPARRPVPPARRAGASRE